MTQSQALDILKTGANVFLSGEPGSGKTHVTNQYIEWLEECGVSVAVAASTGIAATHIGGMTIHSWSGIGTRDALSPYELDRIATKENVAKRVRRAKVLIVDEVSMLSGHVLDMVDQVCRAVRGRAEPFGGLQVVLVGDFFQLPPITRGGERPVFAFDSRAWQTSKPVTCYLTEQHRQEDELLLSLLSAIRRAEVEEEHYTLLSEQTDIGYEHIEPTRLFTHNRDVDALNLERLAELSTETRRYEMTSRGARPLVEGLKKNCLSPEVLELRLEAMVMCTKNNFEAGYVNGTLGRVVEFDREDGYPWIETGDGRRVKVAPMQWSVAEDGKVLAEVTQVPLRLAWAITVHKSQGMSLDAAEIDLRNAFAYGQGYVALSRVRTLLGMKVAGLNGNALVVDPKIVAADAYFRQASGEADDAFTELGGEELARMHEQFVKANGGTMPDPNAPKEERKKSVKTRFQKESTYEETKRLLKKGMNAAEIARMRKMAVSTIWGHVEKLVADSMLSKNDLAPLVPRDGDWEEIYGELKRAMDEHGTEKLKPIYEAAGERHDYDLVRLGRILYTLEN